MTLFLDMIFTFQEIYKFSIPFFLVHIFYELNFTVVICVQV